MRILVLFGGESVEHEISIISACQVMSVLGLNYTVIPVYISKENELYYSKEMKDISFFRSLKKKLKSCLKVEIKRKRKKYYLKRKWKKNIYFDLAFPIVHGKGMEDGTLGSFLRFNKIPVLCDSAYFYSLVQNKALTKKALNGLDIKNTAFIELEKNDEIDLPPNLVFPLIVKPNSLGSSIGIKVARNEEELTKAIDEAFDYDKKVIVEQFLENSNEYNISVTRNNNEIIVSNIEEVIKNESILDYSQKYENNGNTKGMVSSKRILPACLDDKTKQKIETIAKKIYKEFEAKGVIRIDFLFKNELYVNEINAIPGSYSFYLWKGIVDFIELLDIVIEDGKRDIFLNNKLIKSIDKMNIFEKYSSPFLKTSGKLN